MLAPRARKRTPMPCPSNSRVTSSKSFESAPRSVMETVRRETGQSKKCLVTKNEDRVYRALVGFERIAVNRNRIHDFLQELQRRIDVFVPVKWHKAARKQLRHGLTGRQPSQHISVPMLEHEDPRQRRAVGRCIHSLPMPWRTVHPHAA